MTDSLRQKSLDHLKRPPLRIAPLTPEQAAARRQLEAEWLREEFARAIAGAKPGDLFTGQGVFLGEYRPLDRESKSLSQTFIVFAAPQDLTDSSGKKEVFTYEDTVQRMRELKDWHGFDGGHYANDTEVYRALRSGTYRGEWIIPTIDILSTADFFDNTNSADTLYAARYEGAFKGTFTMVVDDDASPYPEKYWSCTEHRQDVSQMWHTQFTNGIDSWCKPDLPKFSCRPVRLVAAP